MDKGLLKLQTRKGSQQEVSPVCTTNSGNAQNIAASEGWAETQTRSHGMCLKQLGKFLLRRRTVWSWEVGTEAPGQYVHLRGQAAGQAGGFEW